MIWLGDVAKGRDNNFNLIRMLAATAVLVSHAWPLVLGSGAIEPLEALTGYPLGTMAVFVFFALSGFFISASFDRAGTITDFLAARGLRLFPGLFVSLIFVALIMAPFATSLSLSDYLANFNTWQFFLRNLTLAKPQYTLPGVFEANPYPAVEGSIWTLVHEVMCYGLVFLAGICGLLRRRTAMTIALRICAVVDAAACPAGPFAPKAGAMARVVIPLCAGGGILAVARHGDGLCCSQCINCVW